MYKMMSDILELVYLPNVPSFHTKYVCIIYVRMYIHTVGMYICMLIRK